MKNLRAILLLFVANTISGMAQGISMLAIPWYFAREGHMDQFVLVYILTNVVSFIWVPVAGVLTDRFDRRNIFLVISVTGGLVLGGIALVGHLNGGLPWLAVASAFMLTFFNYNIHYPNLYAFVQEITEAQHYGRITSALEIQGQVTTMLAGAGAAMLLEGTLDGHLNIFGILINVPFDIEAWTIYEIFTMDAGTYFVAFFVLLLIRYIPLVTRKVEAGNIFSRLKTGINHLRTHKYVTIFGIASYAVFVVVLIEGFFIGPLYVNNHLMASGDVFAASEMYYSLGAITSGVIILRIFRGRYGIAGIIGMTIVCAGVCVILALTKSVALFYFSLLMLGLTNAGTRVLRVNTLFRVIPNELYGRTNSIFNMTNIALRIVFLSLFAVPFFLKDNNVVYMMGVLAAFLVLATAVLLRYYRKFVNY
ncbi:MAG: MFS transporter permease [Bacteroidetes bacterium]|nr:MAG: MFS transporter permease [Bacteroidota bacterium]